MNPPWLRNFETICSVKNSNDKEALRMKINGVGPGMRPRQKPPGSDATPSPAFASESLKRNDFVMGKIVSMTNREDAEAAFTAWKDKKDRLMSDTRKKMRESASERTIHYSEKPYQNYIHSNRPSTAPSKKTKQSTSAAQVSESEMDGVIECVRIFRVCVLSCLWLIYILLA